MGLKEAKAYIEKLHKLQDNPFNWPDYLTGLPDRSAVIKKIDEAFGKPGKFAISYAKITNVHPFIIKYGTSLHAEIIQWAAAILQTTCYRYKNAFVGAVGTHEFIVVSKVANTEELLNEANKLFVKKTKSYYRKGDLEKGYLLSFKRNGKEVFIGFMDLVSISMDDFSEIEKYDIVSHLADRCSELEESGI